MEKIQCRVCDTDNHNFSTTCSECGVRLRRVTHGIGPKKKNRKKIEAKARKKELKKCSRNKITYRYRSDAKKMSDKLLRDKGRISKIYRCKYCDGYHLTKLKSG